LRDFFSDCPYLVNLLKSSDLQRDGDGDLIFNEYVKWKKKQNCLIRNDTLNSIFTEYLSKDNDTSYVLKALIDADKYYKPKAINFFSSLVIASFLSPVIDVPYVLIVGSKEPKEKNLHFPDSNLKSNEIYNKAYKKRAKQIKMDSLAKGGLLGDLGLGVVVFLLY
jgi:hypothetical protein